MVIFSARQDPWYFLQTHIKINHCQSQAKNGTLKYLSYTASETMMVFILQGILQTKSNKMMIDNANIATTCLYTIWWLVERPFSQKYAKIVNSWGLATQINICMLSILLWLLDHKELIGEIHCCISLRNIASTRHFQPLSEKDDEVLLSDCAMFCSARLWRVPLARFTHGKLVDTSVV